MLGDHPMCEEFLRQKPDWAPAQDSRTSNTVAGLRMQAALDAADGVEYRRLVAAGEWFAAPDWRARGAALASISLSRPAAPAPPPESCVADADVPQQTTMAELAARVPRHITLSRLGKFRRYPLRRSRTNHVCAVCNEIIGNGDAYHDGGRDTLRAHQACVADAPIEIAMVGPPSLQDIEDAEAAGLEIMLESPTLGCLWLVCEPTGKRRKEMTFRAWAALCKMAAFFPGSRFTRVVRAGMEEVDSPGEPVEVRCTCHPEAVDDGCPVGAVIGNHQLASSALITCECRPGWSVAEQRERCPLGRAFGGHSLPEKDGAR